MYWLVVKNSVDARIGDPFVVVSVVVVAVVVRQTSDVSFFHVLNSVVLNDWRKKRSNPQAPFSAVCWMDEWMRGI